MPSRLSPQWPCGNSCTWAHDVRLTKDTWPYIRTLCPQVHELPQSHCGDNRKDTLFSWLHIYYAHLVFVRSEHSVCRGSLMTTYIYIYLTSIYTIILYILNILYIYYILNFPCIVYRITYLYSEIATEKCSFKYVFLKIKQTAYFSKEIITKTEKINVFIIVI